MNTVRKTLIAAGLAGIAVAASAPAFAQRDWRDQDVYQRYGYGEQDYGRGDYDRGYGYRQGDERQLVSRCLRATESEAERQTRGDASVTEVTRIQRQRGGLVVLGRVAVKGRWNGWDQRGYDGHEGYERGYSGYDRDRPGYDAGTFACQVSYGQVSAISFRGIRGL